MLCGRRTCMHSGILRSAFQTPVHEIACGGLHRRLLTGGFANGTPSHARTPEARTLPATSPSSVRMGAMGVATICAKTAEARIAPHKTDPDLSLMAYFLCL